MRAARAVVVAAIAIGACTHDYDALMGSSGTGGMGGTAGTTGTGGGTAGSVATAGKGGAAAGGTGGTDAAAGTGGAGPGGRGGVGGSTGATGGSAGGAAGSAGAGGVGNSDGRGGTGGAGNTVGAGGTAGTGNTVGRGGTGGTFNTVGSGGTGGTGNTVGSGGRGGTGNTGGSSVCPGGQIMCPDTTCIPATGDGTVAHCGGCNACPVGATACTNGTCGCSVAGQMLCGGTCVDTNTNNSNCGGCNHPCTGTCQNGTCMTSGCGTAFAADATGFVTMPSASGTCWHGYAFTGGDVGSVITPANFSACGTPCTLRMSGTVGAATPTNNYSGLAYLGFTVAQDKSSSTSATITPTGTSVTVTFSASTGGLPLRAELYSSSMLWCYTITTPSPVTIPYSAFNTACWDGSGSAYAKQPFLNFQLVVPGGLAATPNVSVTLTSVKEN